MATARPRKASDDEDWSRDAPSSPPASVVTRPGRARAAQPPSLARHRPGRWLHCERSRARLRRRGRSERDPRWRRASLASARALRRPSTRPPPVVSDASSRVLSPAPSDRWRRPPARGASLSTIPSAGHHPDATPPASRTLTRSRCVLPLLDPVGTHPSSLARTLASALAHLTSSPLLPEHRAPARSPSSPCSCTGTRVSPDSGTRTTTAPASTSPPRSASSP